MFVTLQSLLERIDSLRASKKSLAAVLTAQRVAAGSASMKRKNQVGGGGWGLGGGEGVRHLPICMSEPGS